MTISLLTLDLDDTLWPCRPVIQAAEAALYAWLGEHCPRLTAAFTLEELRQQRLVLMRQCPERAHDITWIRRQSLRQQLNACGADPDLAEPALRCFLDARNAVEPYAEVLTELTRWRCCFSLVAVTNGNAEVEATPLRGLFHRALTAAEVGAAKPKPDLFFRVMEMFAVRPEQMIHIGDDPELDIETAGNLGLMTVWVNRSGQVWPAHLRRPDLEIARLEELSRWFEEHELCISR